MPPAAAGEEVHELAKKDVLGPPKKGPLLHFDFVEFFGGSGRVSACMAEKGHSVAPCLDLTASRHYDMTDARSVEWCMHMIQEDRFRPSRTEPPAPPSRQLPILRRALMLNLRAMTGSVKDDLGTCWPSDPLSSFVMGRDSVGHAEKSNQDAARWRMRAWQAMRRLGFVEAVIVSCQFSSPHNSCCLFFAFLLHGLDPSRLEVKCPGGHTHVKIQGQLTKRSAVYTWALADHLANEFSRVLRVRSAFHEQGPDVAGLDSVVSNDLPLTSKWRTLKCWHWKRKSHINVLKAHAGLGVLAAAAEAHPDSRFVALMDSRVAKGALTKGRSSSDRLQKTCKRSAAIQLAFGLYPGWNFAPTRLNVADDPTRRAPVRSPSAGLF